MIANLEAGFPSPSADKSDHDSDIDMSITSPRHDLSSSGHLSAETPSGRTLGPRQRRFEFDAKIIRDSIVRKLTLHGRADLVEGIDGCHRDAVYKRCTGCRVVKTFYNRCEQFFCPICAARLARDRRETVEWWTKAVGQAKHVVLTVKSIPVLTKSYVRTLKDDLRKLRNQKWCKEGRQEAMACIVPWMRNESVCFWREQIDRRFFIRVRDGIIYRTSSKWIGGFWSIDSTWNPPRRKGEQATVGGKTFASKEDSDGGFHLHFHAAVDAMFIDSEWLEIAWSKLRKQDFSVVEVINVQGQDYTAEVCKYVCDGVQLGNWPAEILVQFIESLTDERCFGTFGALYKQRAEFTKALDEIHADRNVCECGCSQWQVFSENEWEWQQAKSSLSPPGHTVKPGLRVHPELFAPSFAGVK